MPDMETVQFAIARMKKMPDNAAASAAAAAASAEAAAASAASVPADYSVLAAQVGQLMKAARLYPFACPLDTELKRTASGQTGTTLYKAATAGIRQLRIVTASRSALYVERLYSRHSSGHYSRMTVRSEDGTVNLVYTSAERESTDASTYPTETFTVTGEDGTTMTATVDWSLIPKGYSDALTIEAGYLIDEGCVLRR